MKTNGDGFIEKGEAVRTPNGITIAKSGRNTAGNFYETVAHEAYHEKFAGLDEDKFEIMFGKGKNYSKNAEEALVRDRLLSHRFSSFWEGELNKKMISDIHGFLNTINVTDQTQVRRTLQNFGLNYGVLY